MAKSRRQPWLATRSRSRCNWIWDKLIEVKKDCPSRQSFCLHLLQALNVCLSPLFVEYWVTVVTSLQTICIGLCNISEIGIESLTTYLTTTTNGFGIVLMAENLSKLSKTVKQIHIVSDSRACCVKLFIDYFKSAIYWRASVAETALVAYLSPDTEPIYVSAILPRFT